MNDVWLANILESGDITDNSIYQLSSTKGDVVFKNKKVFKTLYPKPKRRNQPWHYRDYMYRFLVKSQEELSLIFNDQDELKKRLIFFNDKEYEHNTIDPLFQLDGVDENNWTLKTGNLVGFVTGKVNNYSYNLKVSSRFGDDFLKALIADAEGFLEVENFGGSGGQSDMEWLLIYFWKIKLKRAFRLGIPKVYRSKREVLPTVRGNIDILDYAIAGRETAKYKCSYREHSYANPVNQLINTTFQKLRQSDLLKDTSPIRRAFETAVEGKKMTLRALKDIKEIKNPYFHPYNEVIDLSRKLLREEFADFQDESDTNALFFDVSMLFEYFIRKIVAREGVYVHQKNEIGRLQIPSGGKYKKGLRALYPDLIFDDKKGRTHVFDVKYKRYDFTYGVKREDLFQIHTYLGQVANHENVVRCGLIYPISGDEYPEQSFIENTFLFQGKRIVFEIHFFKVPALDDKNYRISFNTSKENFLSQLLQNKIHG